MTDWGKPGYERVYAKIQPEPMSGCWLWTGSLTKGYGGVWFGGAVRRAHRVVYELERGAIPEGLQLDHLCRNRSCVNPDHLEPVTQTENVRRGDATKNKGACATCGGPLDGTRRDTSCASGFRRVCLPCMREKRNTWYRSYLRNPEKSAMVNARSRVYKRRRRAMFLSASKVGGGR